VQFEGIPYELACWLKSDDQKVLDTFMTNQRNAIVSDRDPVFLAKSEWEYNYLADKNPDISFLKVKELG